MQILGARAELMTDDGTVALAYAPDPAKIRPVAEAAVGSVRETLKELRGERLRRTATDTVPLYGTLKSTLCTPFPGTS
jgi:hypothetical protein